MDFVIASLREDWQSFLDFAPKLIYAALLLAVSLLIAKLVARSAVKVLARSPLSTNVQFFRRLISLIIVSIGLLLALGILGLQGIAASLVATGGIVAVVLGFAFREIGENFLAGFFLTFSRPFEIGDLVKTGDLTGIVRAIELRSVHIRTFDACDVYVPSAQIFREPLHNFTRDGLRRPSFTVGVAYHDDPAKVLSFLERAAADVPDVLDDPPPFVTIKEFAANYIEYEVFFFLDVNKSERGFIGARNDVKSSCWRALRDAGMTFSTDVTTGIAISSAPELTIATRHANLSQPGLSSE